MTSMTTGQATELTVRTPDEVAARRAEARRWLTEERPNAYMTVRCRCWESVLAWISGEVAENPLDGLPLEPTESNIRVLGFRARSREDEVLRGGRYQDPVFFGMVAVVCGWYLRQNDETV